MSYTPGTVHIARHCPDGSPAAGTWTGIPSAPEIKDPGGVVVLSGSVSGTLDANGEATVNLPPTHGMNPDPVTWTFAFQLYGQADPEPVTGVEIISGQVTELATWTSVVPGPAVPNVEATLQGYATAASASASSASASATAAGASATAAAGSATSASGSASAASASATAATGSATAASGSASAAAASAASISGLILTGTGSPEGVRTANPGTEYVDAVTNNPSGLLGTMGGARWRKRSGTGNTGWVCVEGDTGNRNIATALENGWTVSGGVRIARENGRVTFTAQGLDGTAATGPVFYTLPAGFSQSMGTNSLTFLTTDTGGVPITTRSVRITPQAGGQLSLWPSSLVPPYATPFIVLASWRTTDAWPTSLPGTATSS